MPALILLLLLVGCASPYATTPEPTGEWVPANPASLLAGAQPTPLMPR